MRALLGDIAWGIRMVRIRRVRRRLIFSKRRWVDDELRPFAGPGTVAGTLITYPDAFYTIGPEDYERAIGRIKP